MDSWVGRKVTSLRYKRDIQPWEHKYWEVISNYSSHQLKKTLEMKCFCISCNEYIRHYRSEIVKIEGVLMALDCYSDLSRKYL